METVEKKPQGKPMGCCKKCHNHKPIEKDGVCTGCSRRDKSRKPKETHFLAVSVRHSKRYHIRKAIVDAARIWRNDRSEKSVLNLVDAVDQLEALYRGAL